MSLYLPLGKNSADEIFQLDLDQLQHLFISYCHEEQVNDFFTQFTNALIDGSLQQPVWLAIASTRAHFIPAVDVSDHLFRLRYLANNENQSNVKSRSAFLQQVIKEASKRQKQINTKAVKAASFTPFFILLHDVFDMILAQPKSTGLNFLKLLINGPGLNIHIIGASTITYRNLIQQLVQLNPLVALKFKDQTSSAVASSTTVFADQLVLSAEDFVYFKSSAQPGFQRFFPLHNKAGRKELPSFFENEQLPPLQLTVVEVPKYYKG